MPLFFTWISGCGKLCMLGHTHKHTHTNMLMNSCIIVLYVVYIYMGYMHIQCMKRLTSPQNIRWHVKAIICVQQLNNYPTHMPEEFKLCSIVSHSSPIHYLCFSPCTSPCENSALTFLSSHPWLSHPFFLLSSVILDNFYIVSSRCLSHCVFSFLPQQLGKRKRWEHWDCMLALYFSHQDVKNA